MLKALIKKQFLEVFASVFIDKRKGTKRSSGSVILNIALYLLLFGVVAVNIYLVANQLCEPLVSAGLAWFYFALFGLASLLFGVLGSAFSTYNSIYVAKDNEMLFSMPIKPRTILLSRLVSVYLLSLLYTLIVFAPAAAAYFRAAEPGIGGILLVVLAALALALLSSAVSCVLGWLISLVARRLKNKSFVTVLVAILFLGLYYFFYFRISGLLAKILASPLLIANVLKGYIYPFYLMGEGAAGDAVKLLLFALMCIGAAAIVYFIISLGFAKSVISGGSVSSAKKNAVYSESSIKAGSASSALFKKELLRFTSSPNYMLNANIGLVFMVGAAVALLIMGSELRQRLETILTGNYDILALIACGAVCLLSGTNITTASSVSLEGKHIWLPQSLPVDARKALLAKLRLHLTIVLPPLALLLASVIIVFRFPLLESVIMCVVSLLYVLLIALIGLAANLKWTNLHWTNEVIPIKQSMPVFISMFGSFAAILLMGGLYFLLKSAVPPLGFLFIAAVLFGAICFILYRLIVTWGARRYAELG